MHFSQKFQWVLLLQDCFNAHNKNIGYDKGHFEDYPKEKGRFFIMPCFTFWSCFVTFCHASPNIFYSKNKNFEFYNSFPTFWGQKLKFTIHLSLFTRYCSWHYSLRNFAYLRGVVPYISSKFLVCLVQDFFPSESYPLWAFLWEISSLTITSLHFYYPNKACK